MATTENHYLANNYYRYVRCDMVEQFVSGKHRISDVGCADVLKHLIYPWTILADRATYIKQDGELVLSLPNVQQWRVWVPQILTGHWKYCEACIMDRTHLHVFTRVTRQELLMGENFKVIECQPSIWRKLERMLSNIMFCLLEGWLASQWVLVGSGHPNEQK